MSVSLSSTIIDTNIDVPLWPVSAKKGSEISVFFESGTEVPMTTVSKAGKESLGIEPILPIQVTLSEPSFEDKVFLYSSHENDKSKIIFVPKLEGLDRQDHILTHSVRKLLRALYAIVISRALQVGIPIYRTIISVFEDPTEQYRKAILRLSCEANAVQALAFWDSLEPDLKNWVDTLSENDRTTYITKLGLRIHWR